MRKLIILGLALAAVPAHAQQMRTTCYDSGPTRICETFDQYGAIISKSRCYQSGHDTRCDTQSSSGTPTPPLPLPRRQ